MSEYFTISQINKYLKNIIESDPFLTDVWLKGEISNFKAHYSGHLYLTLKDENSSIRGVMFKGDALKLKIIPEDGMKVLVKCRIGVYEASGSYQAYIREMTAEGVGDLYTAYTQLKEKLEKEGLFAEEFKKPILKFPEKIGVITSGTGAAVQDIINILSRRYPIGEVIIYPSLVQGEDAPEDLVNGLSYFNEKCPVDVIIIGRGGGSIEDLWAFNQERVARAVFASDIPVISAVGHETDFTICDFVADLRAPTPSAAAELAATPINEIMGNLNYYENKITSLLKERIEKEKLRLKGYGAEKTLSRLKDYIKDKHLKCDELFSKIYSLEENIIKYKKSEFLLKVAKLEGKSPLKNMEKGYLPVFKEEKAVKKIKDIKKGDNIRLVLVDGEATAEITEVKQND